MGCGRCEVDGCMGKEYTSPSQPDQNTYLERERGMIKVRCMQMEGVDGRKVHGEGAVRCTSAGIHVTLHQKQNISKYGIYSKLALSIAKHLPRHRSTQVPRHTRPRYRVVGTETHILMPKGDLDDQPPAPRPHQVMKINAKRGPAAAFSICQHTATQMKRPSK